MAKAFGKELESKTKIEMKENQNKRIWQCFSTNVPPFLEMVCRKFKKYYSEWHYVNNHNEHSPTVKNPTRQLSDIGVQQPKTSIIRINHF
jgi:hypothetical protein